jgi:methyl-accepting chemotaxis protein
MDVEISDNIQQISGVIQLGAHSAQQISNASAGLSGLSVDLKDLVARFRC